MEAEITQQALPMKQKILYQAFIAFGQGTGGLRVHRTTCQAIHDYYSKLLDGEGNQRRLAAAEDLWARPDHGPQALERVRATGRLAALHAVREGRADIEPEDFEKAAAAVRDVSAKQHCDWCPPESGHP